MRAHFGTTQFRREIDGLVVSEVLFAPWSRVPAHRHDTPQLSLVISGEMRETGDDRAGGEVHGPRGACFRPAGYLHHNAFASSETRGLVIEMQSPRWQSLAALFGRGAASYVATPQVPALYRRIRRELTSSDPASPVALESALLDLIATYARALTPSRIDSAKRLLADTHHSIAEIALRCGFYDQAHFTRVFGRVVGTTPGRYRASSSSSTSTSSREVV